jgi:hypothetical protein
MKKASKHFHIAYEDLGDLYAGIVINMEELFKKRKKRNTWLLSHKLADIAVNSMIEFSDDYRGNPPGNPTPGSAP